MIFACGQHIDQTGHKRQRIPVKGDLKHIMLAHQQFVKDLHSREHKKCQTDMDNAPDHLIGRYI